MSGDLTSVLQDLCYCGNSTCRYCGYARQAREMQAEIERLRAEREDIDLLHVPWCTDDDLTFCHECVGDWPCRTHLRLHPEEARRER